MSQQCEPSREPRQLLSALVDGEIDPASAERLCLAWRDDLGVRRDWHTWHMIGDVLRSDDLACAPTRDSSLLLALRARLAAEPVVLAPASPGDGGRSRRLWAGAAAVAAGFAAVAGTMLVVDLRGAPSEVAVDTRRGPSEAAPRLAQEPVQALVAQPASPAAVESPFVAADGKLIRDARLDRYLAAHKPVGGSRALAIPSSLASPRAADAQDGR